MPSNTDELERISDLKSEIETAKHNLWVAKTHVQDRQENLTRLEKELEKLEPKEKFVDTGCACSSQDGHCDCYGA